MYRSDFGGRRNFGPREMTKVVCSDCGKECEVPFKPTEGRAGVLPGVPAETQAPPVLISSFHHFHFSFSVFVSFFCLFIQPGSRGSPGPSGVVPRYLLTHSGIARRASSQIPRNSRLAEWSARVPVTFPIRTPRWSKDAHDHTSVEFALCRACLMDGAEDVVPTGAEKPACRGMLIQPGVIQEDRPLVFIYPCQERCPG